MFLITIIFDLIIFLFHFNLFLLFLIIIIFNYKICFIFYLYLTIFQIISGYTIMSGIHNNVLFFCSTFFFLFLFFTAFSFYFLFSMIEISQMPSTFNIWLYVRDILWKVWCFVEIWFLDVLTLLVSESGLWFSLLRLPQSQKPASESCSLEQNKFMSKNYKPTQAKSLRHLSLLIIAWRYRRTWTLIYKTNAAGIKCCYGR